MISPVAWFIVGLLVFLFGFGFFIAFLARRLKQRISRRLFSLIEGLIIAGIVLGIFGMFQPWALWGFRVGFNAVLISTLAYIAWSHVTPRSPAQEEDEAVTATSFSGELEEVIE